MFTGHWRASMPLAIAAAFMICVPAAAAPTLLQYSTYQTSGSNGETQSSVQFDDPTKAGDTIWVVATISDYAGTHALTITDTQGNIYAQFNQENDGPPGSQTVAQFYASNIAGDTTTPNTVTLSAGWDDYRGLLIAEIAGTAGVPAGNSANIQDGLPAGSGNVTSGSIAVAAGQTPGLLLGLSMNTSGGSSDTGGSGFGGPAAATGFIPIAQFWNWGLNLATFESAAVSAPGSVAALFNAPDTDSYVTVATVFPPAASGTPPTLRLSASPASIVAGGGSTLTWVSTNATACSASGGWSGSQSIAGSVAVSPVSTASYSLLCSGPNGPPASASTAVDVTPPLPTAALSATSTAIEAAGSTTLNWTSTYASTCTAAGAWTGSVATTGSLAVSPTATGTYVLTCSNASGVSPAAAVTVAVTPPVKTVPKVKLSAAPATLVVGATSTLKWSSTNATSCTASGAWSGEQATSGTLVVTPAATATYTLACTNANGTSPALSITVTVQPPKPTVTLSASPRSIDAGASSTLTWSATNAASCTASGAWSGTEAPSGALSVAPAVTSTYSIACSNVTGTSAVHSVTITVKPVVAPALVQFATHQTAGTNGENDSAVQFTAVTKANDTIWVAATLSDYAGVHAISVSDTQGNVYHLLNQKNDGAPGYQTVAHFYATNIVGDTVVPDTITVNWTYDNYKGVVIAEIDGATTASLVGRAADIQDGLAAGTDNVTSGNVAVASDKVPALMVGLSMNTSGGSSDLGGSGYGGPAAGTGFTPVAQFWQWGVNLATLETALITSAQSTAAVFDAPDTDSYVTVAVVFH